jgi:hypothetical protein
VLNWTDGVKDMRSSFLNGQKSKLGSGSRTSIPPFNCGTAAVERYRLTKQFRALENFTYISRGHIVVLLA